MMQMAVNSVDSAAITGWPSGRPADFDLRAGWARVEGFRESMRFWFKMLGWNGP